MKRGREPKREDVVRIETRAPWQITQAAKCGCRGVDDYCPCQNVDQSASGPCIYCGAVGYAASFGGPGICPSCDCGHFNGPALAHRNAKLTKEVAELRAALTKASPPKPWPDCPACNGAGFVMAHRSASGPAERLECSCPKRPSTPPAGG